MGLIIINGKKIKTKKRKCTGCGILFDAKLRAGGIWQEYHNSACCIKNNHFRRTSTIYPRYDKR